jgi:PAS domain-containing protein
MPTFLRTIPSLKRAAEKIRPKHVVYFAALFSLLTGLLEIIAWIPGARYLVRPVLGDPAMDIDTAILCALAAASLLAVMRNRYRISRTLGAVLAVAGNIYFSASLADVSVSLHNLFPAATAQVLSPAQMHSIQIAPPAAILFVLFGCALALVGRKTNAHTLGATAAIGLVTGSIGVSSLFGSQRQAALLSQMGPAAAACGIALGLSLCALVSIRFRWKREQVSATVASVVVIGLILIFGGADMAVVIKARAAILTSSDVRAAYAQMRAVQKVVAGVRLAESAKRGFLLTRDDKFLATFMQAKTDVRWALRRDELALIPQWQAHNLQTQIELRMDQMSVSIELEMRGSHSEAVALVKRASSLRLSDQIETEAGSILAGLQAQAVSSSAAREALLRTLMTIVVSSFLVAALLVAASMYLVRLEILRRNHLEGLLRKEEAELAWRVKEKTRELRAEIKTRKATEDALRAAERFLEAALRFSNIVVWVWNSETDKVNWIGNFSQVFGFEEHTQTYAQFRTLIHPDDRALIDHKLAVSMQTGANYRSRFRVLSPDGKYRVVGGIGGAVKDEDGKVMRMAGINYKKAG